MSGGRPTNIANPVASIAAPVVAYASVSARPRGIRSPIFAVNGAAMAAGSNWATATMPTDAGPLAVYA